MLAGIYAHTSMEVFELMVDDRKKFYQEPLIVQAYHNRLALHAEGVDSQKHSHKCKPNNNVSKLPWWYVI